MPTKKLRTSLRNSITAEKSSIEQKPFAVNEEAKIDVLQAEKNNAAAARVEVNLSEAMKTPSTTASQTKVASKQSDSLANLKKVASNTTSRKIATKSAPVLTKSTPALAEPPAKIISVVDAIIPTARVTAEPLKTAQAKHSEFGLAANLAVASNQFVDLYLESIDSVSQTFNDYLKEIMKVKDLSAAYNANLEFFSKVANAQQELIQKNTQLFKHLQTGLLAKIK